VGGEKEKGKGVGISAHLVPRKEKPTYFTRGGSCAPPTEKGKATASLLHEKRARPPSLKKRTPLSCIFCCGGKEGEKGTGKNSSVFLGKGFINLPDRKEKVAGRGEGGGGDGLFTSFTLPAGKKKHHKKKKKEKERASRPEKKRGGRNGEESFF